MTIYDFGVGGYDIVFTAPDLTNGQWIAVSSKAGVTAEDVATPSTAKNYVVIGKTGDQYYVAVEDSGGDDVDRYTSSDLSHLGEVRIVFHNEFVTVYVQDYWIHTFWFDDIYHPEEQVIRMSASESIAVSNIRLKELSDWREAIFVDMETNSQNAISSVILQRPIEIRSAYGGEMVFVYDPDRQAQPIGFVKALEVEQSDSPQGCSDAIVYFTNAAVVVDEAYAEQVGFVTRMYRFPDLDNGAIKAATIQQRIARQSRKMYRGISRFHPNVEVGDIVSVSFPASGSNLAVEADIIIDSLNFNLDMESGTQSMAFTGRDAELGRRIVPATQSSSITYDWYVDSVSGSDSYDGMHPASPFRTIAKLLTVMGAGQSVSFAKGSIWQETYTAPGVGCVAVTHGSGAAPIFDCRDVAAAAGFTKTGGQTNVYQATLSPDLVASGTWNSMWEDDVRMDRATSIANCDATPGSYYPSSDAVAPMTMYVHASNGSNPATSGKVYKYAKRLFGVDTYDYSNCGVNGVVGIGNLSEAGSIRMGLRSIAYGCEALDGNKHNMYVREGCWVESTTASEAYYAGGSTSMFVYNENTPSGGGITFANCIAQVTLGKNVGVEGFYGHYNVSGSFGTVLYDRCVCTNLASGFNGAHANIVLSNCSATNCNGGVTANSVAESFTMTETTISIPDTTGTGMSIQTGCGHVSVDGCLFVVPGARVSQAAFQCNASNVDLSVTNTTFRKLVYALFWYGGTGGTIDVSGCDFDDVVRNYDTPASGPAITSDYNRFRDAGQDFSIQGTLYGTVAAYQSATGQDSNSTVG